MSKTYERVHEMASATVQQKDAVESARKIEPEAEKQEDKRCVGGESESENESESESKKRERERERENFCFLAGYIDHACKHVCLHMYTRINKFSPQ